MSMMSTFSVTSPVQILNHPMNSSQSKFQYSFSKSNRFDSDKSYCLEAFYGSQQMKRNRSTSMGCGNKSDFTKSLVVSPSPDAYSIQSKFDTNRSQSKGKTFGTCREKMKDSSYIANGPLKNPGPGEYRSKSSMRNDGYSMRPKTCALYNPVFLDGKTTYQSNPGPGQYKQGEMITKFGRQTVSNFRSSGATTFNPPTSKRFGSSKTIAPGPGAYKPRTELDEAGRYVLSQNRGDGTRVFPTQQRKSFTDVYAQNSITPGPGNYRAPSEFGNYDHIDLYRSQGDFSSDSKRILYRPSTATK